MYRTCLFCTAPLGSNEAIEFFPVGRRLAFDPHRGRLWVVCQRCERWCLSPLEERWEAIEECERAFSDTRLRVSTENIGLARLREGLELVRVGEPKRPEMAAWRYGDQFGRRRRRALVRAGLGLGAVGAAVAGGVATGFGVAGGGWWILHRVIDRAVNGSPDAVVAHLSSGGELVEVRRKHLAHVQLRTGARPERFRLSLRVNGENVSFEGPEAAWAAGHLLPALNRYGGTRRQVSRAVDLLQDAGDPVRCFATIASTAESGAFIDTGWAKLRSPTHIAEMSYPVRLALEMAAHEDSERQALQGELATLEAAWRRAEEIAAISDSLLVPPQVEDWIRRTRGA